MKNQIVFQTKISWTDKNFKHIELTVTASSAQDLIKKIEAILSEKSKWSLLKKLFPTK